MTWVGDTLHLGYRAINLDAAKSGFNWKTVDVRYLRVSKNELLGTKS